MKLNDENEETKSEGGRKVVRRKSWTKRSQKCNVKDQSGNNSSIDAEHENNVD